jgi:hypothetical protein
MVRPPGTTTQSWFPRFGLGHNSQTIAERISGDFFALLWATNVEAISDRFEWRRLEFELDTTCALHVTVSGIESNQRLPNPGAQYA